VVALTLAVAAAFAVPGCGGSGGSVDVVSDFVDEYRSGDYDAACDRVDSNTASFDLPDMAGVDFTAGASCPQLLRRIAKRGNSPLDDDAALDVTSVDESDVADSSTIETRAGTWTLETDSDQPGGWVITGLPSS
jgi:hypothetical protein